MEYMAETNEGKSSQSWTSTQAYVMAVLCLLVGCAVGYLLRGSVGEQRSTHAATVAWHSNRACRRRAWAAAAGQQQMPSPEQMKAMADKRRHRCSNNSSRSPMMPPLLAQIGNAYYDAQIFPMAIDYYQKALAVDPKNSLVRTDMATALFYSNDFDHSIAEFDRALKDDPKNSNALFNRGIVKWQGKMDVNGAIADWELLLKQNPNYEQADKVRMYMAQAKKHANIKPGQKTDKPAM